MAKTKIINVSGQDRFFGYVPPHGAQIANNGHVTIDGDLKTILASGRGRYGRPVELSALNDDIANGVVYLDDKLGDEGLSSLSH